MRILVVGEGKSELGEAPPGPLATLALKLLRREPDAFEIVRVGFGSLKKVHSSLRHKGSGDARKVKVALIKAADEGFDALVLVHDRDCDRKIAREMRDAPNAARQEAPQYSYPPVAVGIAIETFDAWMLADECALSRVLGQTVQPQRNPEHLDGKEDTGRHPKDVVRRLIRRAEPEFDPFWKAYPAIAAEADIATLEKVCEDGFGPFAKDVRVVGAALGLTTEPGGRGGS